MTIWFSLIGVFLFVIDIFDFGLVSRFKKRVKFFIYISCIVFSFYLVYVNFGRSHCIKFILVFLSELILSIDNLFAFIMIFSFAELKKKDENIVLSIGIFFAIFARIFFIYFGKSIVLLPYSKEILGIFLIYTGFKTILKKETSDQEKNIFQNIMDYFNKIKFLKNKNQEILKIITTVIAFVLMDVIFAIDSIPASFSITKDNFLLIFGNLFAVLGLRGIFSIVNIFVNKIKKIHYFIGSILIFIGIRNIIK